MRNAVLDEGENSYLSSEISGTTLGHLQDNGRLLIASSFKGRHDGGRGGYILPSVSKLPELQPVRPHTIAGMANFFSWA